VVESGRGKAAKGLTLLTTRERLGCALPILVGSCLYVVGDLDQKLLVVWVWVSGSSFYQLNDMQLSCMFEKK
jgi:hypothetical protein